MASQVAEKYEDKKADVVVKDFGGVNTQAERTAIAENEFAWLENLMPVGFANMRAVPHQGTPLATTISTIVYWKYVNISNVDYLVLVASDGGALLLNLSTYAFTAIGVTGTFTLPVAVAQWENERILLVDANNYYSFQFLPSGSALLLRNGSVESVDVTDAGTGYTSIPTVTFTGGSGTGAAAVASMMLVGAQTITVAGVNYVAGDILTLAGGTSTSAAKLHVDTVGGAGDVTGVSIYQEGSYSVLPASPNAVTGGSGTGCTITTAWGVESVLVNTVGTTPYISAPTVGFSGGAGADAAATAVLMLGPDGGQTIATCFGRVWVGKDRTVSYSAPDSFVDFTEDSAGGSFVVTDETLRSNIKALLPANNFLYLFGDASINVISDVRVVPGTPYVTVFSNTNVSPFIGSSYANTIFPYNRNIVFATQYGFYALVGATPQKISDPLDGMFGHIDFGNPISANVTRIYNILCMAFLFSYDDPLLSSTARSLLALQFNKKWFFASQGNLTLVTGGFQSGVPQLFGTDGQNIYRLFSDTTTDIHTTLKTAMWPMKEPTRTKQTLKAGVEITTAEVLTEIDVTVDTESSMLPFALSADSAGEWVNASGDAGEWENDALVGGEWITFGFQIFQGDVAAYGRYIGYTMESHSPGYKVQGLLMQYERKAKWPAQGVI